MEKPNQKIRCIGCGTKSFLYEFQHTESLWQWYGKDAGWFSRQVLDTKRNLEFICPKCVSFKPDTDWLPVITKDQN